MRAVSALDESVGEPISRPTRPWYPGRALRLENNRRSGAMATCVYGTLRQTLPATTLGPSPRSGERCRARTDRSSRRMRRADRAGDDPGGQPGGLSGRAPGWEGRRSSSPTRAGEPSTSGSSPAAWGPTPPATGPATRCGRPCRTARSRRGRSPGDAGPGSRRLTVLVPAASVRNLRPEAVRVRRGRRRPDDGGRVSNTLTAGIDAVPHAARAGRGQRGRPVRLGHGRWDPAGGPAPAPSRPRRPELRPGRLDPGARPASSWRRRRRATPRSAGGSPATTPAPAGPTSSRWRTRRSRPST